MTGEMTKFLWVLWKWVIVLALFMSIWEPSGALTLAFFMAAVFAAAVDRIVEAVEGIERKVLASEPNLRRPHP